MSNSRSLKPSVRRHSCARLLDSIFGVGRSAFSSCSVFFFFAGECIERPSRRNYCERKVARPVKSNAWNEVFALILLGVGTLLFLALISYTPKDVPSWIWFSQVSSPNKPAQNFIGPFGAIVAGFSYMMMGAASYFLAVVLLGFGGAKLFNPSLRVVPRIGWIALFLVSGACLLQLQTTHLQGWRTLFNIPGAGGWIGYVIGKKMLLTWMGGVGSMILLGGVYISSLILMTGLRPIHIVRESIAGIRRGTAALREWSLKRRLRKSDLKERLAISQEQLVKQQRVIEKQLKKKGAPVAEPAAAVIPPEEFLNRPKPKVVDTTALPSEPTAKKKPSLAELRGAESKAKSPAGLTSKSFSAENYILPGFDLLDVHDTEGRTAADPAELEQIQQMLIDTLGQFGIEVAAGDITKGPTITRFEVYPAKGVRVDKIVSLERDLARATRAERINILAPIPGKDTVGIELANTRKVKVTLRELLQSADWEETRTKSKIPLALGKDVYGKTIIADLAQMPHLLVAGTTGSGKSVCINALVASMIFRFTPEELRFIMIDPKVVEMQMFNALPHLSFPVVTDPKKVLLALRYVIDEMEKRYKIFAQAGVRNITSFNARPPKKTQKELDADVEAGVSPANGRSPAETAATPIKVHRDDELVIP